MRATELPPSFDEQAYLRLNPDVARAVAEGHLPSGREHYLRHGWSEDRAIGDGDRPTPLSYPFPEGRWPGRRDKILANLRLHQTSGVEIGALAAPLVTKSEGRIFYVDHADQDQLREKYKDDESVDKARIVYVDAIWGAQTLQECIGQDAKVDYVVASHVIEHVPDLITWLAEVRSVLKPEGSIRLAVPDRRYTFDYLQTESQVSDVLESYLLRRRSPLPRFIISFASQSRKVDCRQAWDGVIDEQALEPYITMADAIAKARDSIDNGAYHDAHCWFFTPVSFAELFMELAQLNLVELKCSMFFETPRNRFEFYVHLSPSDNKSEIVASWSAMKIALLKSHTYQKTARDTASLDRILRAEALT